MFLKVTLPWPLLLLADFEYDISSIHLCRFLTLSGYFMKNSKQSLTDSNTAMCVSLDLLSTFI